MNKPKPIFIAKAKELLAERTYSSMDSGHGVIHLVEMNKATASVLLTLNTHNRRLQDKHVAHLAHQIDAGQWRFTGDAIRISKDWVLIDGQHRLNAIYAAASPFTEHMVVITGLDPDAVLAIDQNEKRTMADMLGFIGLKGNSRHIASTVRKLLWFERDFSASSRSHSISTSDINEWIASHSNEVAIILDTFRIKVGVPPMALSMFAVLAFRANPLLGQQFVWGLSQQYGRESEHPFAAICNNVEKLNASSDPDFRKAIRGLATAWNRWLEGDIMPRLFVRTPRHDLTKVPELLTSPGEGFSIWDQY